MGLFEVDKEKCKRDGICVAECPFRLIEQRDELPVPTPVEGAEGLCIGCGHCVAVCPQGALSQVGMKPSDCPPLRKDMTFGIEQVEHLIRSRRSIRVYRDEKIERDTIGQLIDVAHYAPTGSNSQQVKWLVLNSRDSVRSMAENVTDFMRHLITVNDPFAVKYPLDGILSAWEAGYDLISRGAPALVFAHAPKDYAAAQVDSTIALTTFDLAAPSFGLGTCWAGFFMIAAAHWPPLQQALSLPEGNACFGAMMVGYPKYRYHRLPLRKKAEITWR